MVLKGIKSPKWKGINAKLCAKHKWLDRNYGQPRFCEFCLTITANRYDWANISGFYKRDRFDYKRLCRSCHQLYDGNNKCRKGHELSSDNIYLSPKGIRTCKQCKKETQRLYKITHRKRISELSLKYYYRNKNKTKIHQPPLGV